MKRIFIVLFWIFVLLSCSTHKNTPNLNGTVTLSGGVGADSIYVGLYYHGSYNRTQNWDWLADPKYFSVQADSVFSFQADPGRYTLFAFAYGYEVHRERIFIPDAKTKLTALIHLVPIGIDSVVKEVKIAGDFCDWKIEKAPVLVKKENRWMFEPSGTVKKGDKYQFVINGLPRNDISNKNRALRKDRADFVNLYNGDSIVFDPSLYKTPRHLSTAKIKGYDLLDQYNRISDEISATNKRLSSTIREIRKSEPDEWEKKYNTIISEYDSIGTNYDPCFQQLLIEMKLDRFAYLHPAIYDLRQIWKAGKVDSVKFRHILKGEKFNDFISIQLNLLQSLNPESFLLEGDFASLVTSLDNLTKEATGLREKYNLSEDYFYDFIIDFVNKSPKKTLCTHMLYQAGANYAHYKNADKARHLINWLKKDYADKFYVGKGHADKVLARLDVLPGSLAPDFEVTTLEGKKFRLFDCKGKFVFIDFWGSWCGPCIGELSNFSQLATTISRDKLQVIGLAKDDEKRLREYLEKEPLPYPNALVPDEVIRAYGVTGYPTTFLIDPEGIICEIELRGKAVVELVKEKMESYKQNI